MAQPTLNFQNDAEVLIQETEGLLLALEKTPDNQELLYQGANGLRTIRGIASLFNLDNITRLTTLAADSLDTTRRLKQEPSPSLVAGAIGLLDHLRRTSNLDIDDRTTHNLTTLLAPFANQTSRPLLSECPSVDTRILVVDDEEINLFLLEEFIRSFNKDIQVTTVDSAAEALYLYFTEKFDLVFLDIMMPVIDGNHFISIVDTNRAAHHINGGPNIVVQTAVQSLAELLTIVRKESVLEVIRKPIIRERICTCIERYCPAFQHG